MQHSTKQKLHGHLLPITQTMKVRLARQAGQRIHMQRFLWTTTHGNSSVERRIKTCIRQLCVMSTRRPPKKDD